uniref:Putative pheromone receptor n=1 Tax=Flammulina velutipes KACC42780 TaxID=1300067 RepID=A0A2Z6JIH6_FLAVE|nr:TPA_inf: putative pheromone receptor [Flammulina velutipes KACC42780]
MRAELAVLSFLSVVLIVIILLFYSSSSRNNSTVFALAIWLLICNAVYGIDSILWADNIDIHIPAWCDIVTRILLAANVALPGASLGISMDLERIASSRPLPDERYMRRTRLAYDIALCFLIPIFYASLHLVVQDRRFNIVQDFGCGASIHPSIMGAALMLVPPSVISLVAFIFSSWTIYWSHKWTSIELAQRLQARSSFSLTGFRTRLALAIFIAIISPVITIVSVLAHSTATPWVSWTDTHAKVEVIQVTTDIRGVQTAWVGVFVISFLFVISLVVELDILTKWFPVSVFKQSRRGKSQDILLPMVSHDRGSVSDRDSIHTIQLVSGWDEMLHAKPSTKKAARQPLAIVTQHRERPSEDDIFAADTMRYLSSPQARTLGVISPTMHYNIPPHPYSPPPPEPSRVPSPYYHTRPQRPESLNLHNEAPEPQPGTSSSVAEVDSSVYRRRPSVPEDAISTISTLYDIPWPLPPVEAAPNRSSSRFSTIDGADYPITRALLDQRKSPPVRITSKRRADPRPQFDTSVFTKTRQELH